MTQAAPGASRQSGVVLHSDRDGERPGHDERDALRLAERAAHRRFVTLARANALVASATQDERVLERLLELPLPSFGDLAILELAEPGARRCMAAAAPALERACPDVCAQFARLGLGAGWERALVTHDLSPEFVAKLGGSEELRDKLAALGACSVVTAPVRDQDHVLGTMVFLSGPSGPKHTAEDLALAEELGRCAGSAVTQARLFAQAQTAIQTRDEFLSIAGHELRTPLTALQLQVQSIARLLKQGECGERVTQRADKAARNVMRVSNLVDELLDVSRIGSGKLPLERTWFDLGEAAREVASRQHEDLARAGSSLEVRADPGVVGSWDRARIEQVVANLLTNAAKYGRGQPIQVNVSRHGERARISVRDSGQGIEQDDQERIFQRFARGDTERRPGGLGLGLWIARALVESHGGSIRVQSAPGQGACFEVELPLSGEG